MESTQLPVRPAKATPQLTAYIPTDKLIEHHLATVLTLLAGFYDWKDLAYRTGVEDRFLRHLERLEKLHEEAILVAEPSGRDASEDRDLVFARKKFRNGTVRRLEKIAHDAMLVYLTGVWPEGEKPTEGFIGEHSLSPRLVSVCASLCKVLGHERQGRGWPSYRGLSSHNWLGEAKKFMSYRVKK